VRVRGVRASFAWLAELSGSSMLAITFNRPPQRAHRSISIPNTRFKRRAQFIRVASGAGARRHD
jgi:hypothetical protein